MMLSIFDPTGKRVGIAKHAVYWCYIDFTFLLLDSIATVFYPTAIWIENCNTIAQLLAQVSNITVCILCCKNPFKRKLSSVQLKISNRLKIRTF